MSKNKFLAVNPLNCPHFLRFCDIDQAMLWLEGICFAVRAHSLCKQIGSSASLRHLEVQNAPVILFTEILV